jgi:hypothetical protein
MDSMQLQELLIPLAFVILFAAVITAVLLGSARRRRARQENLRNLGLEALAVPDPALTLRVERLYLRGKVNQVGVQNVFRRAISGGTLYVFDIEEPGGSESSALGSGVVGIQGNRLNLPLVFLIPWRAVDRLKGGGFLVNAAQQVLNWTLSMGGLQEVPIDLQPGMERRYKVYGQDLEAVANYLTDERIRRLWGMDRQYEILGCGDFFTIQVGTSPDRQTLNTSNALAVIIADAQQIRAGLE